ncbi:MAG: hypothetical protein R2753_05025 [Chitinophagales bacterium]
MVQKESTITWKQHNDLTLPDSFFEDIPLEQQKNIAYSLYSVDETALNNLLSQVPDGKKTNAMDSKAIIDFPHPNGTLIPFKIVSTTLMEKALADKFPELKTYEGISSESSNTLIRITGNEVGVDAMILSEEGTYYIQAIEFKSIPMYLVYFKKDFIYNKANEFFETFEK